MKLSSRKIQRNPRAALQMTSMIDVVFLLLIFFMTTASFVRTERNLVTAVKVNKSASSAPSDLEPAIVEIVQVADKYVYRVGARDIQTLEELISILKQFENKLDGAFVRVSDGAPFGMAASAIQACKSAEFTSVSYVPMAPSN